MLCPCGDVAGLYMCVSVSVYLIGCDISVIIYSQIPYDLCTTFQFWICKWTNNMNLFSSIVQLQSTRNVALKSCAPPRFMLNFVYQISRLSDHQPLVNTLQLSIFIHTKLHLLFTIGFTAIWNYLCQLWCVSLFFFIFFFCFKMDLYWFELCHSYRHLFVCLHACAER